MNPLVVLIAIWVLVTGALFIMYLFRSRLESRETDWIPLTEDAREEKAIAAQETIEKKVHRFDRPIQALGVLSVILLLSIISYWVYQGLSTPPPIE